MIDNVYAHCVVFVQCDREFDFGADAIDTGDEHRFFIPFNFKKSAEETYIAQYLWTESCFCKLRDSFFCLRGISRVNAG